MSTSKNLPQLVFFGNEQLSTTRTATNAPIFRMLVEAGYPIEALIIKDQPQRSRKPRIHPITLVADEYNIPVIRVATKQELQQAVQELTSVAGVLVAFGMIIPKHIIEHFDHGIINIHPSLLPERRGTTPIESAILDGATETGVSVMKLSEEMDAGDVYAYAPYSLTGEETKSQLTTSLNELSASLLEHTLPGILDGSIQGSPQNNAKATYTRMLSKDDSLIDWTKSARAIEREVRALADWPGSITYIKDFEVKLLSVKSLSQSKPPGEIVLDEGRLIIGCAEGCIEILELKIPGKPGISAADFINGYLV